MLTPEQLAHHHKPITPEQIEAALEQGSKDRDALEAATPTLPGRFRAGSVAGASKTQTELPEIERLKAENASLLGQVDRLVGDVQAVAQDYTTTAQLLREVRPTLDDINGLLGGEGDPEGEAVAETAGALRDRIDAALSGEEAAGPAEPAPEVVSESLPARASLLESLRAAREELDRRYSDTTRLRSNEERLKAKLAAAEQRAEAAEKRSAGLMVALLELRQQVEDTIMVAQKDVDADDFITAYHFKTGAIHRLLAKARDLIPGAALHDEERSAPRLATSAAEPPSECDLCSGSRGRKGCPIHRAAQGEEK